MNAERLQPGWEPLTAVQRPPRYRLEAALVTTYDPPDPGVLIEDYLPAWLGLENGYSEEAADRVRYYSELESELNRIKQRITIISSAGSAPAGVDAWIWRYIRRLEVGAQKSAVQHAKLWMFHWVGTAVEEGELLEFVVSSANLTRSGLRRQIQAGWRCRLPLVRVSAATRLSAWGVLPAFLKELASSCDESMARWHELLGRSYAPNDVSFIASVPGSHPRATLRRASTCWGLAGLARHFTGSKARLGVMAPFIGTWDEAAVRACCKEVGVEPERLSVAWISEGHLWALDWNLDESSERALTASGITWLAVPDPNREGDWESPFSDEQLPADSRWSHAKLYDLRDGQRRALLVTSANFSRSAWGDPQSGSVRIKNFELGVVFPFRDGFLGYLQELSGARNVGVVKPIEPYELPIAWVTAEWDGAVISVACRLRDEDPLRPQLEVRAARAPEADTIEVEWTGTGRCAASISWTGARGIPLTLRLETAGGEQRDVPVADLRPGIDRAFVNPEFDEAKLREMADALLEERYGYVASSNGNGPGGGGAPNGDDNVAPTSYSVTAYEDARRRFRLIDNWARELEAETEDGRRHILSDGNRIAALWGRQAGDAKRSPGLQIAARIAVEELRRRIEVG